MLQWCGCLSVLFINGTGSSVRLLTYPTHSQWWFNDLSLSPPPTHTHTCHTHTHILSLSLSPSPSLPHQVAGVVGRAETLSSIFYLLTLFCYRRGCRDSTSSGELCCTSTVIKIIIIQPLHATIVWPSIALYIGYSNSTNLSFVLASDSESILTGS